MIKQRVSLENFSSNNITINVICRVYENQSYFKEKNFMKNTSNIVLSKCLFLLR